MNELQIINENRKTIMTFEDWLMKALQQRIINEKRRRELIKEKKEHLKEMVVHFNEGKSSVVKRPYYHLLLHYFDHLINEVMEKENELMLFQRKSLNELIVMGKQIVQEKIMTIQIEHEWLAQSGLSMYSERLDRVIREQIPSYLALLQKKRGRFFAFHCREDLDYPLIDGLPLYHEMYHLQGCNLVLYYSKRLHIETRFVLLWKEELDHFIQQYEYQYQISFFQSNESLCERLFYQFAANLALHNNSSILMDQQQGEMLKQHLKYVELENEVKRIMVLVQQMLPKSIGDYFFAYEKQLLTFFRQFMRGESQLVYEQEQMGKWCVTLNEASPYSIFMKHLEKLEKMTKQEQVEYLIKLENVYDLHDLLNHDLLTLSQCEVFFKKCSLLKMALLLRIMEPEPSKFSFSYVKELLDQEEMVWKRAFVIYLDDLSLPKKQELETIMTQLVIKQ